MTNRAALLNRAEVIWAISKKELKLSFRFSKNFVAGRLIEPLRLLVLFALVYKSFFALSESSEIGGWTEENYIPTLVLGAIFFSSFNYAYYRFRQRFLLDKYWKTIQVFLTAPVSKLDFLIGHSIAMLIECSIPMFFYLLLFQLFHPVPLLSLLAILGCLCLMMFGILGFGLTVGALAISSENYLFIFDYVYAVWVLFSCFYYTNSAIPEFLHVILAINPIYHAMEIARGVVFHHVSPGQIWASTAYLVVFAMVMPFLGAIFFRKFVRELGVRGF